MALPPGFNVTEVTNSAVADPVCERDEVKWIANYKTEQDFHIEVNVPETSPDVVYGLNQTLLLAIRTGIYHNEDGEDIQLWRTPPQTTPFNFKGEWLDSESSDSPYYSAKAMAKTKEIEGTDAYSVTLRMSKNPQVTIPRYIQRKGSPDQKLVIKQFDVQEYYVITLLRDEDVKNGKKSPLAQWTWGYKHAWKSCDDNPHFVPEPGFTEKCSPRHPLINHCQLKGPSIVNGEHHDHFRILDKDNKGGKIGEVDEWKTAVTDDWEASEN